MEDKLQKIFSYFGSIKNEPFYSSCISQIIEIYEHTPQSLKFILYNLNHLIFSNCKELKLRLKHRLICASIIHKLSKIYADRVKSFIDDHSSFHLESFQLDSKAPREERVVDKHWTTLDLLQIIEDEPLLLSTAKGRGQSTTVDYTEEQKNIFDEFLDMNHATMLNIENAFKDVETQNEITDEAIQQRKLKYKSKIDKFSAKCQDKITEIELTISNPFNLMYEICAENILHTEWELRHMSVLILKELLEHAEFLGFTHTFTANKIDTIEARFQGLSNLTKDTLRKHVAEGTKKKIILDQIIGKILILLSLDRFADYQSDESVIIVRMVGAQILARCFMALGGESQMQLIKMLKRIFDRESQLQMSSQPRDKFTWEVKHSFLYFLNCLLEKERQHSKAVCSYLEESLIKMLSNDQIDEITLYVCKVLENFLGEPFFIPEKINRVNRQVWAVVQNLDDISVSGKQTLRLLCQLFPYFNLNEGTCVERLRKFFTSKIPEVRIELYKLTACLLGKKKEIADAKIVEKSLVQFLQGVIVEYERASFDALLEMGPHLIHYTRKNKNLRKVVQFINTCVTPHQFTEEIITSKFILSQAEELNSNEYLYIYEHENAHCPVSIYTDKRTWKASLALVHCFDNNEEGLDEVLKGVEKNNQKNHRARIMVFLALTELLKRRKLRNQPKDRKYYDEYKEIAQKIIMGEFYDLADNQVTRIFVPQFMSKLKALLDSEETVYVQLRANPLHANVFKVLKEISDLLKKSELVSKLEIEVALKLKELYDNHQEQGICEPIQYLLTIIDNIMEAQKQVSRHLKVVAVQYIIQYEHPNELQNLNALVKPILECIKEDFYSCISQATASAAEGLSLSLHRHKKAAAYRKINTNLYYKVSTSYTLNPKIIPEKSIKMIAGYMEGVCAYIQKVGKAIPHYLDEFTDCFLEELKEEAVQGEEKKKPVLEEEYHRLLLLLSGTITCLLSVDNSGEFTKKFTKKVGVIISYSYKTSNWTSFSLKLKKILLDAFVYLSENYTALSNTFFQWFLHCLKEQPDLTIFCEVLQKACEQHLVAIASVCSLFILQIVKSVTQPSLHELAMNSLSNLIVGVYTNVRKNQFSQELLKVSEEGVEFIKNFKNTDNFTYQIKVKLKKEISLRNYQVEGITWLGFLTKYNLNGVLCDDMGLGKTLQVLILMENQYLSDRETPLDSIIVAPTTLINHWAYEYNKYFTNPICKLVMLHSKKALAELSSKMKQEGGRPTIYITNYQLIEKIYEEGVINFKFIILDEGHAIKNVRTNKFKAVKALRGQHKFILTGTPIQNRLIQLWGLFDFLMPGYLYAEDVFKKNYEKLFEVNLTTFKQDELFFSEGQKNALEKLHFKVMPFLLRRIKCDVLRELPEKIINDYYCQLTEVQQSHYGSFTSLRITPGKLQEASALSNLQTMIKIVNHPCLLTAGRSGCVFEDSGKFLALGELFEQFGFTEEDSLLQNKVIVFAYEIATINLIEAYIQAKHTSLKHLKLTSETKPGDRFTVAQTFNGDSDIKVLLVTKKVGGEGLNLSSANLVVMFDHDYNPTVDMQAIDRAHRIGQKKVLNVYRLITRNTLQQKIMGIQTFKRNLANAIVNIDNSSIQNVTQSKLPQLLESVRDLQKTHGVKIEKSMMQSLISDMEQNAIEPEEYNKRY